jgi:hypothetical protein
MHSTRTTRRAKLMEVDRAARWNFTSNFMEIINNYIKNLNENQLIEVFAFVGMSGLSKTTTVAACTKLVAGQLDSSANLRVGMTSESETRGIDAVFVHSSVATDPVYLFLDVAGYDLGEPVRESNASSIVALSIATKVAFYVSGNMQDKDVLYLAGITKMVMEANSVASSAGQPSHPLLYMVSSPCKGQPPRFLSAGESPQQFFNRRLDPSSDQCSMEERNARNILDPARPNPFYGGMIGLMVEFIEEAAGRRASDDSSAGNSVDADRVLNREGVWDQILPFATSLMERSNATRPSIVVRKLNLAKDFINSEYGMRLCDIPSSNITQLITAFIKSRRLTLTQALLSEIHENFRSNTSSRPANVASFSTSLLQRFLSLSLSVIFSRI